MASNFPYTAPTIPAVVTYVMWGGSKTSCVPLPTKNYGTIYLKMVGGLPFLLEHLPWPSPVVAAFEKVTFCSLLPQTETETRATPPSP